MGPRKADFESTTCHDAQLGQKSPTHWEESCLLKPKLLLHVLLAAVVVSLLPPSAHARDEAGKARKKADRGASTEFRSIDGMGNNPLDPEMGATGIPLIRRFASDYADGVSSLAGAQRPGARLLSNRVSAQPHHIASPGRVTDYLWQWGQFLDHDLDLSGAANPAEPADIPVPPGDPDFDPFWNGAMTIPLNRSVYHETTGSDVSNPRQQLNQITAWIDGSNIYGSDPLRASMLRTNDGTGRLATSDGDLLPYNWAGMPNAGGTGSELFLAGDVRANEQVGLTALHTLFVREHNYWADRLARRHRHRRWSGEQIYQTARRIVGAELQAISYREFLPALLGKRALSPYRGYDPGVDASIANAFSTAAYRFGHSLLSPKLLRLDARGREIEAGHLALRDAFFRPDRLVNEGGIDPLLRGLARQICQKIDVYVVEDVRNFLFGEPGQGGFDLVALNIQRGRDHGLPGYNDIREALGLPRAQSFADISEDEKVRLGLATSYDSVDDVDLWVGGLAETAVQGSHLGPVFHRILVDQFEALRDGDRFWYERTLSKREIREVERTLLSDIIRRNTEIGNELQHDVFHRLRRGRR
jgi:hypothetical protein